MPYKDKQKRQQYINEYKKRKRREQGLQKGGRKPLTKEEKEKSKEKRLAYQKEWRKQYNELNPVNRLLYAAKRRAKLQGLPFNLTKEDIVIPEICPYLKIKLVSSRPLGDNRRDVLSLDRIDPEKGYTRDNIEVISWLANTMKNNANKELLLEFAKEIIKRYET